MTLCLLVQADAYELPITLNCDLRAYQREGISWLAFLKRTGLHGCLADVSHLHLCARTGSCLEHMSPRLTLSCLLPGMSAAEAACSCLADVTSLKQSTTLQERSQKVCTARHVCSKHNAVVFHIPACTCTDKHQPCRQIRISLSTVSLMHAC